MKKTLLVLASCSAIAGCSGTYNIPSPYGGPQYKGKYSTNVFGEVASGTIIAPDGTEIPATSVTGGNTVTLQGKDASGNTVTLSGGGCTG